MTSATSPLTRSRQRALKQSQMSAIKRTKAIRRAVRQAARLQRRLTVMNGMIQNELDIRDQLMEAVKNFSIDYEGQLPAVPAEDPVAEGESGGEDSDSEGANSVGGEAGGDVVELSTADRADASSSGVGAVGGTEDSGGEVADD